VGELSHAPRAEASGRSGERGDSSLVGDVILGGHAQQQDAGTPLSGLARSSGSRRAVHDVAGQLPGVDLLGLAHETERVEDSSIRTCRESSRVDRDAVARRPRGPG